MNKFYLFIFLLASCSTPVEFVTDTRVNNELYGSWKYIKNTDNFKGDYHSSSVMSENNSGRIRIVSFEQSNEYLFEYINGDSYICIIDYTIPIKFKFIKDNKETIIDDLMYGLVDNSGLATKRHYEVYNYVRWLNYADKTIIRTTDDCGNTIDNVFDTSGFTHLIPVNN